MIFYNVISLTRNVYIIAYILASEQYMIYNLQAVTFIS